MQRLSEQIQAKINTVRFLGYLIAKRTAFVRNDLASLLAIKKSILSVTDLTFIFKSGRRRHRRKHHFQNGKDLENQR
jgi:hypothetical protein